MYVSCVGMASVVNVIASRIVRKETMILWIRLILIRRRFENESLINGVFQIFDKE